MKKLLTLIVIAAVLAAVFYASYKYGHIFDFLKREPLSIEKTANVVEEIKKIGEFTTACYYEEMALQDADKLAGKALRKVGLDRLANKADNVSTVVNSDNEILLIGKGHVRAGFDLAKVQESDLFIHGDTLDITLPPTEVFDIIMNPSDFTTEYEKGTWSHELTKPIKERARATLEQNAIEGGILTKAEENGKKQLEAIFTAFGFKKVNVMVNNINN